MSNKYNNTYSHPKPKNKGPIITDFQTIKSAVPSPAEAEVAMVYLNGKAGIAVFTHLEEMGHPQEPTQLKTDNNTAESCVNETIQKKC